MNKNELDSLVLFQLTLSSQFPLDYLGSVAKVALCFILPWLPSPPNLLNIRYCDDVLIQFEGKAEQ